MDTREQIEEHFATQPEPKRREMQTLHHLLLARMPACKLWFPDGKGATCKVVSNANTGYGLKVIKNADGSTEDFYQVGMSANTMGIVVYLIGIEDKRYVTQTDGKTIGKASATSYCIKFKKFADIDTDILVEAIGFGVAQTRIPPSGGSTGTAQLSAQAKSRWPATNPARPLRSFSASRASRPAIVTRLARTFGRRRHACARIPT